MEWWLRGARRDEERFPCVEVVVLRAWRVGRFEGVEIEGEGVGDEASWGVHGGCGVSESVVIEEDEVAMAGRVYEREGECRARGGAVHRHGERERKVRTAVARVLDIVRALSN